MPVTVDHEPLAAELLGFETVGQVLAHVQKDRRLVTTLLIDGRQPDLDRIHTVRGALLNGHTVFIETADPSRMALQVLREVEQELAETDRLRSGAVELLQSGHANRALEKLSGCFTAWQAAQESVLKISQILRIDLDTLQIGDLRFPALLEHFASQLRQIKTSLEHRDFVTLCDILTYEATETSDQWREALACLRAKICFA